jgi:hypothetical protein
MIDTQPYLSPPEERQVNKRPIGVDKASPDQKLDKMSRLNFGRPLSVEHNVKVMNVGTVARSPWLISNHITRTIYASYRRDKEGNTVEIFPNRLILPNIVKSFLEDQRGFEPVTVLRTL